MLDLTILKELGYVIDAGGPAEKMSIRAIENNLFAYFEAYSKMGFYFIQFPDQQISIRNAAGNLFKVFGQSEWGCFATDGQDSVVLIGKPNTPFENEIVFANSSLPQFYRSYCAFLVQVFTLKSAALDEAFLIQAAETAANSLKSAIAAIDEQALNQGSFWPFAIYLIDDLMIRLSAPLSDYIDSGRL